MVWAGRFYEVSRNPKKFQRNLNTECKGSLLQVPGISDLYIYTVRAKIVKIVSEGWKSLETCEQVGELD